MKLISVNVARPRPVAHNGKLINTGIFKEPVDGPVMMRATNLDGDGQADLVNHGGEHKAVYTYTHEMYAHWARALSRHDFSFGQFGENLTVSGMPDDQVCIGDVYEIGRATVEVTQPRAPCFKLGIRMGNAAFVKQFLAECRVGFYLRVKKQGNVAAGDAIRLVRRGSPLVSVQEACRLMHFDKQNVDAIGRILSVDALSPAWRSALEKMVE